MNVTIDDFLSNTSNSVDNPAEFILKTRIFEAGYIDFIVHRIKHRIPKYFKENFRGVKTEYAKPDDDEKRAENIARASRRAKQAVQFAVRQIQADHMLTIHTRENISDKAQFFKLFQEFIRLVRSKDFVNGQLIERKDQRYFPFVAVPELQDRGAYHMHLAVVGKQDLNLLRACWYVALGGSVSDKGSDVLGQIDVTSQKRMWGTASETYKTMKLVGYLTKYIGKGFESDERLGEKRYSKSRQIPKVIKWQQNLVACFSNGQQDFVEAMQETFRIAELHGIGNDVMIWNRGTDLFTLRAKL